MKQDHIQALRSQMKLADWWKECGAFISIMPRQIGKTEMLIKLTRHFENNNERYVVAVYNQIQKRNTECLGIRPKNVKVASSHVSSTFMPTISEISECNLLVDEFMCIDKEILDDLLSYNWKTVTMVGTLR
jgi:hypothetical protein